eukprot:457364-Pyramimonas_sp.AAC.1
MGGFSSDKFVAHDKMRFLSDEPLNYGLVFWGSPHWASVHDSAWRQWKDSSPFKTNAWENMSWLSGDALCLMMFGAKYKVEFWPPTFNDTSNTDTQANRKLEISQ